MKLKRVGVDLAKSVFQLHGVDSHEQVKCRRQVTRVQFLKFFKELEESCLVGMEACGSAHYWARELTKLGHEVKLIAPQFVKPYVKSGKNDANDAEAICEAVSRPTMRFVEIKSAEQQAGQALHRVRSRAIRARTALSNEIRGLLGEFGIVSGTLGLAACRRLMSDALDEAQYELPGLLRELLEGLREELKQLEEHLAKLDKQIEQHCRTDERVKRLLEIEGVGPINASALVSAVGNARQFKKGRDFAAWLGLVPDQHSSGGKARLGGITKRGDKYLRCLLIHGARSVVKQSHKKTDRKSAWVCSLISRRNKNIATVALANKNARTIWAILAKDQHYRKAEAAPAKEVDAPQGNEGDEHVAT